MLHWVHDEYYITNQQYQTSQQMQHQKPLTTATQWQCIMFTKPNQNGFGFIV